MREQDHASLSALSFEHPCEILRDRRLSHLHDRVQGIALRKCRSSVGRLTRSREKRRPFLRRQPHVRHVLTSAHSLAQCPVIVVPGGDGRQIVSPLPQQRD